MAAILTLGGLIIAQSPWLFSELGFELPSASRSGSYFINLIWKLRHDHVINKNYQLSAPRSVFRVK